MRNSNVPVCKRQIAIKFTAKERDLVLCTSRRSAIKLCSVIKYDWIYIRSSSTKTRLKLKQITITTKSFENEYKTTIATFLPPGRNHQYTLMEPRRRSQRGRSRDDS
uniref:Uncharacterized protein n=1 Tax=Neogobius melanostomus TaxID=47308 RepID=A0A8C6WE59_9GOBI